MSKKPIAITVCAALFAVLILFSRAANMYPAAENTTRAKELQKQRAD